MEIRTKLRLNTVVTAIIAIAIGMVLIYLDREARQLRVRIEKPQAIAQALMRLNNITLDYLLHPGQRDLTQWNMIHTGVTNSLRVITPEGSEENAIKNHMLDDGGSIQTLFGRLSESESLSPLAREIIAGQLLIKTQAMISDALQLSSLGDQRLLEARRHSSFTILGLIFVLVVALAVASRRLSNGIMDPLQRLVDGVEKVGGGDLSFRIDIKTKDEIGDVARRFDLMTEKLSQSQAELRRLNIDLEQRVEERTAQLEDTNKELEAFAYSVSHDLRTPLRAIDGFSRILLEDYESTLDDEGKRLLNVVRDNTVKMAQLIDDILQFSRMGRREMVLAEVDMERLAHEVIEDLKPVYQGRDLRVDIRKLTAVRGDRTMLHQVLSNLIGNAVKFTGKREAAVIEVGNNREGKEQVFYVKDNGAGFDMQYVDKLFGVFQRLHTVDEFEGTGIGLAIVKRVVTRHGGRVWAESKLDEGATFYFALPAKEESHA